MRKRLVLFCGLPGSGKTTISKKLCEIIRAQLIDLDDFKKTDVDQTRVKNQVDPPEVRWIYYHKGLREAVRLFAEGIENVVFDEVFHLAELREEIEIFCEEHAIDVFWIEIRCPYTTIEERLRSRPRIQHILSNEETLVMYQLFEKLFEPFVTSKPHVVIENTSSDQLTGAIVHILNETNLG